MSAKIEIEELNTLLTQAGVDQKTRSVILKEAQELAAERALEKKDNGPKSKNEFAILIRGDSDLASKVQQGWVIVVPEGTSDDTVISRCKSAAKEHNNNSKRKKGIISVWRDFFLYTKRKFTKSNNVQVKTKEAVRVFVLDSESVQ